MKPSDIEKASLVEPHVFMRTLSSSATFYSALTSDCDIWFVPVLIDPSLNDVVAPVSTLIDANRFTDQVLCVDASFSSTQMTDASVPRCLVDAVVGNLVRQVPISIWPTLNSHSVSLEILDQETRVTCLTV